MKERPILFQGAMVRALLAGTKTQTRRVAKCALLDDGTDYRDEDGWPLTYDEGTDSDMRAGCPYGQPGDRLWVREAWMPDAPRNGEWADTDFYGSGMSPLSDIPECYRHPWHCLYRATWEGCELVGWKPSIHMPRWASRILLEVTEVRVQRLWEISEADARAEGWDGTVLGYAKLWESINGKGSWDANPWVWALSFRRVQP